MLFREMPGKEIPQNAPINICYVIGWLDACQLVSGFRLCNMKMVKY